MIADEGLIAHDIAFLNLKAPCMFFFSFTEICIPLGSQTYIFILFSIHSSV